MILWITLGAKAYVAIFTGLGGADALFELLEGLDANPYVVLALMMLILVFLGTVLDEIGIILLTVPVFPAVNPVLRLRSDLVRRAVRADDPDGLYQPALWLHALLHQGHLAKSVSMATVYRGILPFFLLQVLGLLICVALPDLVTWLPERMR